MSENQSREDMNFKEDEDGEEKPKLQSTLGNSGKFQPIKTRLRQLEKDMQELRSNSINQKRINQRSGETDKSISYKNFLCILIHSTKGRNEIPIKQPQQKSNNKKSSQFPSNFIQNIHNFFSVIFIIQRQRFDFIDVDISHAKKA